MVSRSTHPTTHPSDFEAFGHPVPWDRKSVALVAVREMIPDVTTEQATTLIDRVAGAIERDDPYRALQVASGQVWPIAESHPDEHDHRDECPPVHLDVTGAYRLLAHLCTESES